LGYPLAVEAVDRVLAARAVPPPSGAGAGAGA